MLNYFSKSAVRNRYNNNNNNNNYYYYYYSFIIIIDIIIMLCINSSFAMFLFALCVCDHVCIV